MVRTHDIYKQVGFIQQVLAQNKKAIGVFIAAGCPLSIRVNEREEKGKKISDPLIPDVAGLTDIIIHQLAGSNDNPSNCDKLVKQMVEDGFASPNVEDMLSRIRSLKQVAGKGTVRGFVAQDLVELDNAICQIISEKVDKELPDLDTPYHDVAIWARSIEREKPVHIFTTNYDLLIEQAFEEEGCPYFDGFIGSRKAFFDLGAVENQQLLDARWTRLWKIHGSINWKLNKENNVIRSDKRDDKKGYLIYPSHLKYDQSRKMPYLAMLDRLKEFLLTPSCALFVTGFSFNDFHINDVMLQSLKANPTAMVFAFLFGELDDPKYEKARHCAKSVPNLSLMAFDKAIIARNEGVWSIKYEELINDIPGNAAVLFKQKTDSNGMEEDVKIVHLRLGDFARFGALLRELSVTNTEENEKPV
ncbi:SIR2 family NAD-dependent protein deacylase [Longitalea luteola]|uniref:SIR2 family NAD-dependent protein deacylase n=1 Tax=Longitalea luteola TaxID=2812563 RepID=UPI001A977128|nr:SIR2 family protein [Longitalea luteola]